MTQLEINRCVHQQRQSIEKELTDLRNAYKKRLSPIQRQSFETAQVAWERYRSASCEFNTIDTVGGSAHPMAFAICMTEKAKARIIELNALSTCQEGDIGCPSPTAQ